MSLYDVRRLLERLEEDLDQDGRVKLRGNERVERAALQLLRAIDQERLTYAAHRVATARLRLPDLNVPRCRVLFLDTDEAPRRGPRGILPRLEAIRAWRRARGSQLDRYVILDDENLSELSSDDTLVIRTDEDTGLTVKQATAAADWYTKDA